MPTGFLYHDEFLEHEAGYDHPESPDRLRAILKGLKEHQVHSERHFEFIRECSRRGLVQIDPDTYVSSNSFHVALLAAGAAIQGVSGILKGEYQNAFAATRPPGHHATSNRAMGFCLFNNIAIAARYLIQKENLKRVLIMDWDVHHGNGTQDIFYDDPSVIYISLHKKHHYPGTGWEQEQGTGAAKGTKINFPIAPPFTPEHYESVFLRALKEAEPFAPEFILISCGFDAHERDPLGNLGLRDETYARLTNMLISFASQFGHNRIFSILEGGYDPTALANASATHVAALLQ
jgi:acetoin utilization deacetylase AcuC-like enzyme